MEAHDATQVVLAHRLRHPDLAGKRTSVRYILPICGHEDATLDVPSVSGLIHADDDNLIIGEQGSVDSLPESQAVEDRTEQHLVVHRGQLVVGLGRPLLNVAGEVSRSSSHEQPTPRSDTIL